MAVRISSGAQGRDIERRGSGDFLARDEAIVPRCPEDYRDEIRTSPSLLVIPASLAARREVSEGRDNARAGDDWGTDDGLVWEVSGEDLNRSNEGKEGGGSNFRFEIGGLRKFGCVRGRSVYAIGRGRGRAGDGNGRWRLGGGGGSGSRLRRSFCGLGGCGLRGG